MNARAGQRVERRAARQAELRYNALRQRDLRRLKGFCETFVIPVLAVVSLVIMHIYGEQRPTVDIKQLKAQAEEMETATEMIAQEVKQLADDTRTLEAHTKILRRAADLFTLHRKPPPYFLEIPNAQLEEGVSIYFNETVRHYQYLPGTKAGTIQVTGPGGTELGIETETICVPIYMEHLLNPYVMPLHNPYLGPRPGFLLQPRNSAPFNLW